MLHEQVTFFFAGRAGYVIDNCTFIICSPSLHTLVMTTRDLYTGKLNHEPSRKNVMLINYMHVTVVDLNNLDAY